MIKYSKYQIKNLKYRLIMGDIIMLGKLFSRSRRSAQVEELQNRLETLQEEYEKMVAEKNKTIEYWKDAYSKAVESLEKAMLRFNEENEKVKYKKYIDE